MINAKRAVFTDWYHITAADKKQAEIDKISPDDKSDINWNTAIADIDRQLYKKYGLSKEEIDFIETHVKEMA